VFNTRSLTTVVTSATVTVIALTGCAIYLAQSQQHLWPMLLASTCATLLVMSMLHADLQRLYGILADREEKAHREARVDSLTGLGNRKYLMEILEERVSRASGPLEALFLLDLNFFKRVNDTRGHQAGDELLVGIARRIERVVPQAIVARLGGDEFAVIADVGGEHDVERLCRELLSIFDSPFPLPKGDCFVRGSVGVALVESGLEASQLLRRADVALYGAKTTPSHTKIFDNEMIEALERRATLAQDLRRDAVSKRGLGVVFQPIVDRGGWIVGIEALLRWKHPKLGLISPQEIVSIAEEVQLINDLGLFVAEHACRAAQIIPAATIAINASVTQLFDARFANALADVIAAHNVPVGRIQIELKENDLVLRGAEVEEALKGLQTAGTTIAVDDFGSSTSSTAYLRRLGVTVVKLHPDVVRNARELDNIAVMRAKVELARALGIKVVCLGVSSEADRQTALQSGCDMMQGYLFSEPADLVTVLTSSRVQRAA
jgi:diguanylate cyclase (GGDEF)-like protein